MGRVGRNVIANLAGSVWSAMSSLILVPVYIHFMGIEAYGLIGIYATLLTFTSILDLGLSTTLNRELARLSTQADYGQAARDLLRTIEVVYWGAALAIGMVMVVAAPLIAHQWVHAQHLSETAISQSVLAMGVAMALQFPYALYSGGLLGLQKQVALNILTVVMTTIRAVGVIFILWRVSSSVQAFFLWQIVIVTFQTVVTGLLLWNSLPKSSRRARFHSSVLRSVWRFAVGMSGISMMGLVLTQADKVILSRALPLAIFGYYVLATNVASQLWAIMTPVYSAVFPRLTQLVASDDTPSVVKMYHRSSQVLSIAIIPAAAVLTVFAPEILRLWTNNASVVANSHVLVSLLVIGYALNCIVNIPYALMLSYGWTKLPFYQNAIGVLLLVPALIVGTHFWAGIGAASAWIVLNLGYMFVGVQVMHARLLRGEKARWYLQDVGLPLLISLTIVVCSRVIYPTDPSKLTSLIWIAVTSSVTLTASTLITPQTRDFVVTLSSRVVRPKPVMTTSTSSAPDLGKSLPVRANGRWLLFEPEVHADYPIETQDRDGNDLPMY